MCPQLGSIMRNFIESLKFQGARRGPVKNARASALPSHLTMVLAGLLSFGSAQARSRSCGVPKANGSRTGHLFQGMMLNGAPERFGHI